MIVLLLEGTPTGKDAAAITLWNMAADEANERVIADAGAIEPLIGLMEV